MVTGTKATNNILFCLIGLSLIFVFTVRRNTSIAYICVDPNYSFVGKKISILGLEHTRNICPNGTEMVEIK